MGLTFQIPSAVFPLLFCEGVAAGIFAGLALFTGIHGVISRRRAFYAFSCSQSACRQSTLCAACYQPLLLASLSFLTFCVLLICATSYLELPTNAILILNRQNYIKLSERSLIAASPNSMYRAHQ